MADRLDTGHSLFNFHGWSHVIRILSSVGGGYIILLSYIFLLFWIGYPFDSYAFLVNASIPPHFQQDDDMDASIALSACHPFHYSRR